MNKRAFTVGSLFPRNITINKDSRFKQECQHLNEIILFPNQMRFEIEPTKGNLLDVALDQGQALQYKCRKGTCGVCTVKVINGVSSLSLPNEKE